MSQNDKHILKSLGLSLFVPLVMGVLLAYGLMILVDKTEGPPAQKQIVLTESITVVKFEDKPGFVAAQASATGERFELKAGDSLTITKAPSRGIVARQGFAPTYMIGYLLDGTKVDVPFAEIRQQSWWGELKL